MKVKRQIIVEGDDEQINQFCNRWGIEQRPMSPEAERLLSEIDNQDEFEAIITINCRIDARQVLRR